MGKSIDLTGNSFGKLTVIGRGQRPNNSTDKHRYWLCQCECGNVVSVVGTSLTSGRTKSCGCAKREKYIDLTGRKFGRLIVLKRTDDRKDKTDRCCMWLCRCDCGKQVVVRSSNLIKGATKSCGCLRKENNNSGSFKNKYNKYDLSGDYGIGYTFRGEEFYFDLEDYDKIKDYCWCMDGKKKYLTNSINRIRMHRLIMNCHDTDLIVDHINHIPFDNRKANLRVCSRSQNGMNKKIPSNNTSGNIGVSYDTYMGMWSARIGIDNKTINLGRFQNKEDAIAIRKKAEQKYFKEYSYENSMNFSKENL